MKTVLLIVLLALSSIRCVRASGAPEVNITTTDEGVRFRLENWNRRSEKSAKTLNEVLTWLREVFADKEEGNLVIIGTDVRTSFKTVADVLLQVKTAGVERYAVMVVNSDDKAISVVGRADQIRITR